MGLLSAPFRPGGIRQTTDFLPDFLGRLISSILRVGSDAERAEKGNTRNA
jgi:hypothetical protein